MSAPTTNSRYVNRSAGPFAVMDCICPWARARRQPASNDPHADVSHVGEAADGMCSRAPALREPDEMLRQLDQAIDGLVLQPENTQTPLFVCCCCGDCCGVLTNAKRLPEPASTSGRTTCEASAETCEGAALLTRCAWTR